MAYRARGCVARHPRLFCTRAFYFLCGFCALFAGELSAALRTARVVAPVIDKIRIVTLQGFIEEMDFRRNGARFLRRFIPSRGLRRNRRRSGSGFRCAGRRLSRPAPMCAPRRRASLSGGYDFARDARFARLGAIGNVLGTHRGCHASESPGLTASAMMAIDRGRNALARCIDKIVGSDSGAIAAPDSFIARWTSGEAGKNAPIISSSSSSYATRWDQACTTRI
jgi:competence protein ComEC